MLIEIPNYFICPITHSLIDEPVFIEGDQSGRLYERKAIEEHLKTKNTIPHNNEVTQSNLLIPNVFARKMINEFLDESSICSEQEFLAMVRLGNVESLKKLNYLEKHLNIRDLTKEDPVGFTNNTPLHISARTNNAEMIQFLLKEGANPNLRNSNGEFPLKTAARCGSLAALKILFEKTKDVESRDHYSSSLFNASFNGHAEVVRFLLSQKANIESHFTTSTTTPLIIAVKQEKKNVVEVLLENKANINAVSQYGTPLHYAIKNESLDILKILLEAQPDSEIKNKNGNTSLMLSIKKKSLEMMNLLLHNTNTPLMLAVMEDAVPLIQILSNKDTKSKDTKGNPPLIFAINNNKMNAAKCLIENKYRVHEKGENGLTALHCASSTGNDELVKMIAPLSKDMNLEDNNGSTPLHYATTTQTVETLLKNGADHKWKNKNNLTPSQFATENNRPEIAKHIDTFHRQMKIKVLQSHKVLEKQMEELLKLKNKLLESNRIFFGILIIGIILIIII